MCLPSAAITAWELSSYHVDLQTAPVMWTRCWSTVSVLSMFSSALSSIKSAFDGLVERKAAEWFPSLRKASQSLTNYSTESQSEGRLRQPSPEDSAVTVKYEDHERNSHETLWSVSLVSTLKHKWLTPELSEVCARMCVCVWGVEGGGFSWIIISCKTLWMVHAQFASATYKFHHQFIDSDFKNHPLTANPWLGWVHEKNSKRFTSTVSTRSSSRRDNKTINNKKSKHFVHNTEIFPVLIAQPFSELR